MPSTATLGVDLAAQVEKTALCMIEWYMDGRGHVDCPGVGGTDIDILEGMRRDYVTVTAIDAPFGWPVYFVQSLVAYANAGGWPDPPAVQSA